MSANHRSKIENLLKSYGLDVRHYTLVPHSQGLINTSFKLLSETHEPLFIQRLSSEAFRDPGPLMDNLRRVSEHLAISDQESPASLQLISRANGSTIWRDDDGGHWRMLALIPDARALDRPETTAQAKNAAEAFGRFIRSMASIPAPPLNTVIPGFHDTAQRLLRFDEAVAGLAGRIDQPTQELIERFNEYRQLARRLDGLPERTVHNDTKFSNVLFDAKGEIALCVIDLDTTQPGLTAHDFGDMLRSALNPYDEGDSPDASRPLDLALFDAMSEGYLTGLADLCDSEEERRLIDGLPVITFELGIRFLTDHLQKDVYFSVDYPGQNLKRAFRQFQMLETCLANWDTLRSRFDAIRVNRP